MFDVEITKTKEEINAFTDFFKWANSRHKI